MFVVSRSSNYDFIMIYASRYSDTVNRVVGTTLFPTFLSRFVDYFFRGRGGNSISAYGM